MKTVVMELCSVIAQFGVMFFGDSVAKEVVVSFIYVQVSVPGRDAAMLENVLLCVCLFDGIVE